MLCTLFGLSDCALAVGTLRGPQNDMAVVLVLVPRFNPGRLVVGLANGAHGVLDVFVIDAGGDHVVFLADFHVVRVVVGRLADNFKVHRVATATMLVR